VTAEDETAEDQTAGGDPVCWLHLACPECGAIPDRGEEELDRCPRCGAELTPEDR
jgi:ribosomal protein S27AE